MKGKFNILFSPFTVKSLLLKNRIVMPPMGTGYATSFGAVTPRLISYHQERAAGGVGLNIVENTTVESRGKLDPHMLGIFDDDHIPGLRSLTEAVHQAGGKIAIQIGHSGRRAGSAINGGRRPWGPSPISELGGEIPNEMVQTQIDYIQGCFQKAAQRSKQAGFDAVEIHTAHGYLIHQFLSPLSNKRSDKYGGSLQNRSRFALETLARVRESVGEEFPIFCRLSADEFIPGGSSLSEAKQFAKFLEKAGADVIDISAGVLESAEKTVPPMAVEHGCNVNSAAEIKRGINIPVICVGRIKNLEEAEDILQKRSADLIAMGRALLADPALPEKARTGGNICPCIGCNQGCIYRLYNGLSITCLVNPRAGREFQFPLNPTVKKVKKIAVIGGGPGGLEFSRVASERGHKITLYEKEEELGGRFRIASIPPKKKEISEFIDYLSRSLGSSRAEIKTGVEIKAKDLAKMRHFDEIVLAVGGEPICLPLPGAQSNLAFAEEVLQNRIKLGSKVVIIGGGMVGCETAEWIAAKGKQVSIVEQLGEIASDMESRTRKLLLARLESHQVDIICNTKVECFEKNKVIGCQKGLRFEISGVDNIVLALGYRKNSLISQIPSQKVHKIGDCIQPGNAIEAIHEGFLLGMKI